MSKRWCKWAQQAYPLSEREKTSLVAELDLAYCLANAIRRIKPMAVSPRQDWINAHNERKEQELEE